MLLPRVSPSFNTVRSAASSPCPACATYGCSTTTPLAPRSSPILNFVRNATHAAEGRANGPKQGPGKRLGAKKTGEEYVIPGNIIFRQRGTQWHPGENVSLGRDHTIYATQPGFVKYYRNPQLHPKRRYIGVVLRRNDVLPAPPNAARRRRLGMIAVARNDITESPNPDDTIVGTPEMLASAQSAVTGFGEEGRGGATEAKSTSVPPRRSRRPNPFRDNPTARTDPMTLTLRPNYQYREANWEIGRSADRAAVSPLGVERQRVTVHKFVRKDRFAALKVRKRKAAKAVEKRGALGLRGPKGKTKGRAKKRGRR